MSDGLYVCGGDFCDGSDLLNYLCGVMALIAEFVCEEWIFKIIYKWVFL